MTHLGRRDFACPACGRAFGYKHLLQRHAAKAHPASPAPPVGVELFSAAENSSGKVLGNVAGSTSLKVLVTCAKGWVTLSASPAIKTRSTCVPTGSVIAVDRIEPRPDTPLSVTLSEPQPWSVRVVAPS